MMKFDVTARAYNRISGARVGVERTERVDTNNSLFESCRTILNVKQKYEAFWNDLNPNSAEVVFVVEVKRVR